MLGLEDYETLLENKVSGTRTESEIQKRALAETVKVSIGSKKKKSPFETKISEMAGANEIPQPQKHEIDGCAEIMETVALPKTEMEVEERFFLEQSA
jgi:hypothetical protein